VGQDGHQGGAEEPVPVEVHAERVAVGELRALGGEQEPDPVVIAHGRQQDGDPDRSQGLHVGSDARDASQET